MDVKMMTYLKSESEFSRASHLGFWETIRCLVTRHGTHPLSFNDIVSQVEVGRTVDLGVVDVPVASIVGSAGRIREFTPHFLPRIHNQHSKERWRNIYTLAVTGVGFPPIEVYKVGQAYFVEDGHHRVSVARYLHWRTIQAHVTELPLINRNHFFQAVGWPEPYVGFNN